MGVVVLCFIMTTAYGQQRGMGMRNQDPEAMANQQLEQMKEIIKLNNKKEEKAVKEVFLKYAKERQKEFQSFDRTGEPGVMRDKIQKIITRQNEELKEILGEERFKTYDEKMQEIRQQRRRR